MRPRARGTYANTRAAEIIPSCEGDPGRFRTRERQPGPASGGSLVAEMHAIRCNIFEDALGDTHQTIRGSALVQQPERRGVGISH